MKWLSSILLLAWCLFSPLALHAQDENYQITHYGEKGFSFSMGFAGTGVGAFYRKALPHYSHIGITAEFFIMRDDKEFQGFDIFGRPVSINKVNRLFFLPVNIEFKKRLFVNDIEDNFRPHLVVQAGTIFGMNFPKADELSNEFQFSLNAVIGLGVDVKNGKDYFIGIRPQYRIIYFPSAIAGKKNHSNLEIKLEVGGWAGRR
ncbi:MAG: hypothetical protein D6715_10985 [Calditrichaeota bacterium]|nr:MAG: hypothetical protein D6715_10985 [Calditrichota bacterium]